VTEVSPSTILDLSGLLDWLGADLGLDVSKDQLWPDAPAGGWRVDLIWCEIDGRQECVGLAVVGDGSVPFTASLLRRLPLGTIVTEYRRETVALSKRMLESAAQIGVEMPVLQRRTEALTAPRRRYDNDYYQAVADAYDEAMRIGIPPTAHVQSVLGLKTRTQAAKQVARARDRRFLPPTEQRVPKGNV
jgi:hypothetical protein